MARVLLNHALRKASERATRATPKLAARGGNHEGLRSCYDHMVECDLIGQFLYTRLGQAMSTLNPNDALENLELGEAVVGRAPTSLFTKAIRGLLATAVLGSAAAYGAITVKPDLVEYLSFIPGMEPVATQCTAGACGSAMTCGSTDASAGSCEAASSCSGACSAGGPCCAEEMTCPSMAIQTPVETASNPITEEAVSSAQ